MGPGAIQHNSNTNGETRDMSFPNLEKSLPGLALSGLDVLKMSLDSKGNPKLILYSYRWIILLLYCCSNISVGMMMMSVGPIVPKIVDTYDVTAIVPQLCALSFFIMFVPGNFMSLSVLQR